MNEASVNHEKMLQLSAWIDGLLTDEEMSKFQEKRDSDAIFDQECSELEKIINTLSDMDDDLKPSPQFHASLMQRLTDEASQPSEQLKDSASKEGGVEMVDQPNMWQRIKESLLRNRRAWVPATVGLCALGLVLVISNPFGNMNYMSKSGSDAAYPSTPQMNRGEIYYDSGAGSLGIAGSPDIAADNQMKLKEDERVYSKEVAEELGTLPVLPPDSNGSIPPKEQEQKIIYNGNMGLEVDGYEAAVAALKAKVAEMSGYIVSENRYQMDDKGRLAGDLVLRIPYQSFNTLMTQAGDLGKVTHQSTSARDVTTEFVDVQARLKVMEAKENRLLELLEQTGSLADVLAVEQELANTRAELESLKGRLRYLTNQTDYSTINVSIMEKPLAASEIQVEGLAGLGLRLKEAFLMGINGLISFISNLLVWLVGALPALIIGILILWVLWVKWLRLKWRKWRSTSNK
jgi:hypothetical protein